MKFKRIGKIEKMLIAEMDKLDDSSLENLIQECQRLTTTNCSWIRYGLKDIVIALARGNLRWRKTEKDLAAIPKAPKSQAGKAKGA